MDHVVLCLVRESGRLAALIEARGLRACASIGACDIPVDRTERKRCESTCLTFLVTLSSVHVCGTVGC